MSQEARTRSPTLRALGKHLGDTVRAKGPHGSREYRITGEAVFPTLGQAQPLADGAAFTDSGFAPLFDQNNYFRYLVGRFTPGADRAAVEHRIAAISQLSEVTAPTVPVEVDRLRQINCSPTRCSARLRIGSVADGHAVTYGRRRRRDLRPPRYFGFLTAGRFAPSSPGKPLRSRPSDSSSASRSGWSSALLMGADGIGVSSSSTAPTVALLLLVPIVLGAVNSGEDLPDDGAHGSAFPLRAECGAPSPPDLRAVR